MDSGHHTIADLFDQLGLDSTPLGIEAFIAQHRPNSLGCDLPEAPAWTPAQAAFLREAIAADADWALPAECLQQALCQRRSGRRNVSPEGR